jgi:hypothetical protein
MPLFFTTLEETKKHQRMDDVLIHEKMKIWFPKSNFYPEASGQAIGCFTFNILHFLLSHNTKMLFMNSSIQYHLSKIPFNLLIYILKWRCSALYTRFFIGYWINTGCDFYHGPFFMAPLKSPQKGEVDCVMLISHEFTNWLLFGVWRLELFWPYANFLEWIATFLFLIFTFLLFILFHARLAREQSRDF